MNLFKVFRKNSKWIVTVTVIAFLSTIVLSLIVSYISIFMQQ